MKQVHKNYRYEYKGYGTHDSWCDVEIWKHEHKYIVIMTEPAVDGSGTSVTNACEDIATKIFQDGLVGTNPDNVIWIEHYDARGEFPETYDQIFFEYENAKFKSPRWEHIGETFDDDMKYNIIKGKKSVG